MFIYYFAISFVRSLTQYNVSYVMVVLQALRRYTDAQCFKRVADVQFTFV